MTERSGVEFWVDYLCKRDVVWIILNKIFYYFFEIRVCKINYIWVVIVDIGFVYGC